MLDKLEEIYNRYCSLEEQLSDPEIISDQTRMRKVSKEYKDLKEIVGAYHEYKGVLDNLETAQEMLKDEDEDMREMAKEEIATAETQKADWEEKIKILLIPKDPEDERDVIFEIRSGTGGDEASIFAGDLYRMYSRFFDGQKWKTEIVSLTEGTSGGYSKIVIEVNGTDVYGKLKFESGAHRVQRVPRTESQGRVHTSAATVVVMPKLEMEDIDINKADLKIDTFRASGAGGQHVNKTESAIRITHLPTGVVSESQDGRSQHKNKDIAMQRLYQKIQEKQVSAHQNSVASARRSLVGSGDRSDKIRTYNYPQNRVTDHRIGLTLYSLDKIVEGDIGNIVEALQVAETAERMKAGNE